MNEIVYLNGEFISKEKACISPDDRGFYFADGVYEVIKYYKGHPFCFPEHVSRLRHSLSGIRINFDGLDELDGICNGVIEANHVQNEFAGIYLQITRGTARRMHKFPEPPVKPTLYVTTYPMPPLIEEMKTGINVTTHADIRWQMCNIKSIGLLANVLMYQEAIEKGAKECFLVRDGFFTESTHSNIMGVKNDVVYTYPDSKYILPGITKDAIIKLCHQLGIELKEEPISAYETDKFDEFFIVGTGSEVLPVVKIDAHIVGDGIPGKITCKLQEEFFKITYKSLADLTFDFTNH